MHFRLLVERNLDFVQRLDEITEFRLPTERNLNFVQPADDYDLLLKFLESTVFFCNLNKKLY